MGNLELTIHRHEYQWDTRHRTRTKKTNYTSQNTKKMNAEMNPGARIMIMLACRLLFTDYQP